MPLSLQYSKSAFGASAIKISKKINSNSAGRCVSLCAFLVKVANIHFLVGKCILLKKKDVYEFFLQF